MAHGEKAKRRWLPIAGAGILLGGGAMALMSIIPLKDPIMRELIATLLAFGIGVVLAVLAARGRRTTGL